MYRQRAGLHLPADCTILIANEEYALAVNATASFSGKLSRHECGYLKSNFGGPTGKSYRDSVSAACSVAPRNLNQRLRSETPIWQCFWTGVRLPSPPPFVCTKEEEHLNAFLIHNNFFHISLDDLFEVIRLFVF